MKLLSRNTDYAVRAVCYIAKKKPAVISVTELVESLKIPRPFLRKILQALNNDGVLRSYKGTGGGFILARRPRDIYLTDIMETFQGPFKLNECLFKKKICPDQSSCCLKKKIDSMEEKVCRELKAINLESMLRGD